MSRNKNVDYTQYIHEFTDENGVIRYAVGNKLNGLAQGLTRYMIPFDCRQVKQTGKFSIITDNLCSLGGYLTRKQALRRARYLFGGK